MLLQWHLVESRLKKLEERPAVIEEVQERIEFKVDQLKRNMDEPMVQVVQGALEGVLQQDKEEEVETDRRKKNVFVHGVSESQEDNSDLRVDEDLAVLAAMFHEVGADEVKVESVVRLGRKNEDSTQPRPMKVVLDSMKGKVKLLCNAKNLRTKQEGGWTRVFIHQDLTPKHCKKANCSRAETTQSQWGKRSDHLQRKSSTEKRVPVSRDNLSCAYINARNIVNKLDQFEAWAYDLNPDIIGVTESWTGNHILDSELALDGYDLFRQDREVDRDGGGVLLYTLELHCVQFSVVYCPAFPNKSIGCYILDSTGQRFYIGICYRTPTVNIYGNGNHELLQDIVNELGSTHKHFVLMGDFNYRYLQWPPLMDDQGISTDATQFYYCLEEKFFTQHVDFCTRKDAILDLVISDEPNVIQNMIDLGPFPGSDHNALGCKLEIRTKHEAFSKHILDYNKADIAAIKTELCRIDWNILLENLSAEDSWKVYKDKVEMLEDKLIPVKSSGNYRKKPLWMTRKVQRAVTKKRQVYRKYKDPTHPAYVQAERKAKTQIRKAKKVFERKLAKKIKEDRKSFSHMPEVKAKAVSRLDH